MILKITLSNLLLFFVMVLYGQEFAIIKDKDGFVNVRQRPDIKSKVIDKLKNGELVFFFEPENNWMNIDYHLHQNESKNGYVYHDRLKFIHTFENFKILKSLPEKIVLGKEGIQVILTSKKFDKKAHQYQYVKEAPGQIDLIDQLPYYGQDGGIPETQYDKITISLGKKTIELPKSAIQNLYEPTLYATQVFYDEPSKTIYIQGNNSDGAGSYLVVWRIVNGQYQDKFIAYGF